MNVLSLFDGISCGQVALERAGIKVDKYFASEIDKHAIQVTQKNYPDTIQLGDVTQVKGKDLPRIDLLIGGSPCQGFSFAGKQLNFIDPRSRLFFEYVRLLNEVKPKYFLLENVKMKKEYQDVISRYMGAEPIEINSSLVSAQNRKRLYWTNIPCVAQPKDKGIILGDILVEGDYTWHEDEQWAYRNDRPSQPSGKAYTLRAQAGGKTKGIGAYNSNGTHWRKMTPVECERLQTLPDDYTGGISNAQRHKCIGNCWTVDVIVLFMKLIQEQVSERTA